ncbi:MAG: hypothetical protein SFZ23_06460 [Planctomycetota bacterium]|nr:hypothetical protein [Planctomycetota bacterium]
MASPEEEQLIAAASALVRRTVGGSPELQAFVVALGHWLVAEAGRSTTGQAPISGQTPTGNPNVVPHASPMAPSPAQAPSPLEPARVQRAYIPIGIIRGPKIAVSSDVVPLKIGDAVAEVEVRGTHDELGRAHASAEDSEPPPRDDAMPRSFEGIDLSLVESRCRLKAESCRFFIRRRSGGTVNAETTDIQVNTFIEQAKKLPECFLWIFWRHATQPDDATLARIADCYDATGAAAALLAWLDSLSTVPESDMQEAMQHMAEATSALRLALQSTWLTSADIDQDQTHQWLKHETAARRIFVPRHMKLDDPANPEHAQELLEDIRELRQRVEARQKERKDLDALVNRIAYHSKRADAEGKLSEHDAQKIVEALAKLTERGIDLREQRLRRAFRSLTLDSFPPALVSDTLREFFQPDLDPDEPQRSRNWSQRVLTARELLRGSTIVMIGGERRQDAVDRLCDAFELEDVEWVRLTEHGSSEAMRAPISRPQTKVVVVLIALTGHLHAEDARRYADAAEKPCVHVKAGYNPEQVAEAILQQAEQQLRTQQNASA